MCGLLICSFSCAHLVCLLSSWKILYMPLCVHWHDVICRKTTFVTCFVWLKMSFAIIVVSKIITNEIFHLIKQVAKTYFSTIVWTNICPCMFIAIIVHYMLVNAIQSIMYPCTFVDAMSAWKKLDSNFMNGLIVYTLKNTKSLVDGGILAWPIFEE
jgi:hypothetical protein